MTSVPTVVYGLASRFLLVPLIRNAFSGSGFSWLAAMLTLSLLVLPLYIPALIFGAGAVEADLAGLGAGGHLSLLGALLALGLFFAPWAATAALRVALE